MVSTTAHALCCLAVAAAYTLPAAAYTLPARKIAAPRWRRTTARRAVDLSPFEEEVIRSADDQYPLTLDNVEMILDELRPYLMSDGGNVRVSGIEGPVVRLQLEGACGDCPSSTMTMKMGLERRLKEAIPEISEVVQVLPDARSRRPLPSSARRRASTPSRDERGRERSIASMACRASTPSTRNTHRSPASRTSAPAPCALVVRSRPFSSTRWRTRARSPSSSTLAR